MNPADAYVPAPWRPDYRDLRERAYAAAIVTAACVANADQVDDFARRMARTAIAYDTAAADALGAWFRATQEAAA